MQKIKNFFKSFRKSKTESPSPMRGEGSPQSPSPVLGRGVRGEGPKKRFFFPSYFGRKFGGEGKKVRIIAVVAIVFLAVGGGYLLTYAQQFIDSFLNTDRIADQWNVEVDTVNGEVKLATRTCNDTDWFCSLDTTCVNTLGDGDYIIVKRVNEASKQWKVAQTNCDKPHCGIDGSQDGDQLVADNTVNFNDYPARQACKDAGGRLPTLSELQCIYTNRVSFGNNFGTSYYWSGTEYSATNARGVNFSDGSTGSGYKTYSYSVRCVRGW
ncbi:MAG: DUF1566 domain-containing protein [Candidatus Moraniibacteriota bacterium]